MLFLSDMSFSLLLSQRQEILSLKINKKLRLVALTVRTIAGTEETVKEVVDNELEYEFFEKTSSFSEDLRCTCIRSDTKRR